MIKPAVFIDRDNTLIVNDGDLGDPDEVVLMKGAASAVASLRGLGYAIVVVTNQGGVARGAFTEQDVDAVHARINALLQPTNGAIVDRFYYCPFHPQGRVKHYTREHPNRKPQPGMLLDAARELNLDLSQSWMIGDQVRDIQAGKAAGTRTILLREDAPHLVPLDVDHTEGVQRMPPEVTPEVAPEAPSEVPAGVSPDRQAEGLTGVDEPAGVAEARETSPGADKPHYYARSLIEAVGLVAQPRMPETAGELAAQERAGRKWDPQAVAKLREQREAERGADQQDAAGGRKRVMVGTSSTSRQGRAGSRPFEPAGHYHQRPHGSEGKAIETPQPTPPDRPGPDADAESDASEPPLTEADTQTLEPHELAEPEEPAPPLPQPDDPSMAPVSSDATTAAAVEPEPGPDAEPVSKRKPGRTPPAEATLRQILQELRDLKAGQHDFSYPAMLAIVLQVVAVVCLAGGLWLAADTDGFLRWLGGGLMAQLAAITMLLLSRER